MFKRGDIIRIKDSPHSQIPSNMVGYMGIVTTDILNISYQYGNLYMLRVYHPEIAGHLNWHISNNEMEKLNV